MKRSDYENVKRSLEFSDIKYELREEGGKKKIRGYASVFESPSKNALWGDKKEIIGRGAFSKTIRENKDIKALFNHNTDKVLGAVRSGTLTLSIDANGLYFEIDPAEELRSYEKDLLISIDRGDISGCSFGFYPVKYHYEERDGEDFLIIDELKLFEISIVPFPAYTEAGADFRNEQKKEGENTIDSEQPETEEPDSTDKPDSTQDQPGNSTEKKRSYWENQMMIFKLK